MKKLYFLPCLLLVCTAIFLQSCAEKNEVVPTITYTEWTGAEYLQNVRTPAVLFQYAIHDATTDELIGFFIDKKGEIRTYHLDKVYYDYREIGLNPVLSREMDRILLESEATGQFADLDLLVDHYKDVRSKGLHSFDTQELDAENIQTTAFYTYGFSLNHEGSGEGCSGHAHAYPTDDDVVQITLLSEGQEFIMNTASFTDDIVNWLKSFEAYETLN